jgi:hypothetical protein
MQTHIAYALSQTTGQTQLYVARNHTQLLDPVNVAQVWLGGPATLGYTTYSPFPSPIDGGMHLSPIFLGEGSEGLRGQLPGLYAPHHLRPMVHRDTLDGVTGLSGRTLQAVSTPAVSGPGDTGTGRVLVDLTGPWR